MPGGLGDLFLHAGTADTVVLPGYEAGRNHVFYATLDVTGPRVPDTEAFARGATEPELTQITPDPARICGSRTED